MGSKSLGYGGPPHKKKGTFWLYKELQGPLKKEAHSEYESVGPLKTVSPEKGSALLPGPVATECFSKWRATRLLEIKEIEPKRMPTFLGGPILSLRGKQQRVAVFSFSIRANGDARMSFCPFSLEHKLPTQRTANCQCFFPMEIHCVPFSFTNQWLRSHPFLSHGCGRVCLPFNRFSQIG